MKLEMKNRLIVALTFIFFSGSFAIGQEVNSENDLCNQEYAQFLVSQQVGDSRTIREADKRIKILARSADFLWPYDEPTARGHFAEAYKIAVDNFREKGIETKKTSDDPQALRFEVPDHRFEVIRAIVKRDAAWAKKLTEEILAEFEKAAKDRNESGQTREVQMMLRMANEAVESDPSLSWYLYRRAMRYPLDYHWMFAISEVTRKNSSMATALYAELLQNYRNESIRRLLFLSSYPFGSGRLFGIDKYQFGVAPPAISTLNPELQRQFLEVFFARIAAIAASPDLRMLPPDPNRQPEAVYMISALNDIEPILISDLPFMMPRFSVARSQATSLMTAEMRKNMDARESQQSGLGMSFEERIEALEEADELGTLEDAMIFNLVSWLEKTEDQFQTLEPWLDKIKDEGLRKDAVNYYWFLRAKRAVKDKRFDDAEKFAAKIPGVEDRAILAFDIVDAQLENGQDAASAYQTLAGIAKLAASLDNSTTKAKILLGIANKYQEFNTSYAIAELAAAIRVINRLENPDLSSTSIFRQVKGKNFMFYTVFSIPGYDLETTIRAISKDDFGLTLSNAQSLEDKYLRTIAVLAVARNCIDKPKAPIEVRGDN